MSGRIESMVAAATLAVLTLASPLGAPTGAAAQDDERALARDAFRRGVARYSAADYQGALESFQEAYRIAPNPAVRVNMANCYERLDRPDEAIFNYERFLSEAGPDVPATRRTEVEAALAALRARFAELSITVSRGAWRGRARPLARARDLHRATARPPCAPRKPLILHD